ncbi:MAG: hypothetical protein HQM09_16750 [Candidatus Riflebacteria bacterium]|nr:hypothetical protein [Candidatus Riflebacteria bacterium]
MLVRTFRKFSESLSKFGTSEKKETDILVNLVKQLFDGGEDRRRDATKAIIAGNFERNRILEAIASIEKKEPSRATDADLMLSLADLLARINPPPVMTLIKLFSRAEGTVRSHIWRIITDLGADVVVPDLIKKMVLSPGRHRLSGSAGIEAVREMILAFGKNAVSHLIKAVGTNDFALKGDIILLLGRFGRDAETAIPILSEYLAGNVGYVPARESSHSISGYALEALAAMRTPESIDLALNALSVGSWPDDVRIRVQTLISKSESGGCATPEERIADDMRNALSRFEAGAFEQAAEFFRRAAGVGFGLPPNAKTTSKVAL